MARQVQSGIQNQQFPRELVSALALVGTVSLEQLRSVSAKLAAASGVLTLPRIVELLESTIEPKELCQPVFQVLYAVSPKGISETLNNLRAIRDKNPSVQASISQPIMDGLTERLNTLIRDYPALERQKKAIALKGFTGNWCNTAHFICDIRPVFDEDRGKVEGMIPIQTLRLGYTDSLGQDRVFEICVDEELLSIIGAELEKCFKKYNALANFCESALQNSWTGVFNDPS